MNGKVKALYFFHAAAWATRGREALTYRLHRADGSSLDIPVRCETEIWDWWITPGNPHVAWSNLASRGFYLWRWENPEPEKEILRLDLLSARNEVTAMVVAITAEYCDTESNIRRCPFRMAAAWGFDTGLKKHPDGRLEVVVSERSKPWSGLFVPFSGKLRTKNATAAESVSASGETATGSVTRKAGRNFSFTWCGAIRRAKRSAD